MSGITWRNRHMRLALSVTHHGRDVMSESNRGAWPVGRRVARKKTEELGTVIENDGSIKVKWDNGRTSYYRHGEAANIELKVVTTQ